MDFQLNYGVPCYPETLKRNEPAACIIWKLTLVKQREWMFVLLMTHKCFKGNAKTLKLTVKHAKQFIATLSDMQKTCIMFSHAQIRQQYACSESSLVIRSRHHLQAITTFFYQINLNSCNERTHKYRHPISIEWCVDPSTFRSIYGHVQHFLCKLALTPMRQEWWDGMHNSLYAVMSEYDRFTTAHNNICILYYLHLSQSVERVFEVIYNSEPSNNGTSACWT